MTLPSSGQIDILQILAEFSAPVGTPLTSMVRGGSYVPNTPSNAGVPTAPPIDVLDFLGASATQPVDIHSASFGAFALTPDDATIVVNINPDGQVKASQNLGPSINQWAWLLSGSAADWDIRATLLSGALTSGVTGTWLNGGSGGSWTVQRTSNIVGVNSASLLIEVRPAGGGATVDSGTFDLTATVDA